MWLFGKKRSEKAKSNAKLPRKAPKQEIVTPGDANTTQHDYEKLAIEGYSINVIGYRSINLIADGVASIPIRLFKGDKELSEHPLLDLLKQPNSKQSGEAYITALTSHLLIAGDAFALEVSYDDGGEPVELWTMRPNTMTIAKDGREVGGYAQTVDGRKATFDAHRIMHWKKFNPLSDWYGMAPLRAAALGIDTHNNSSKWNLALIQNGGKPSGVLYQEDAEEVLTEAQFQTLKQQVDEQYTGAENAGRPLLLEGGLKWDRMGLSPSDMDWSGGKKLSAAEIATAFGVPPQMVGVTDAQTYANYQEARQSLWEDTVIPTHRELLGELNRWLTPRFGDDLELKQDLDQVPALEAKRRAKFESIQKADFLSVNEKREAFGKDTVQGGDVIFVNANMLPLDSDFINDSEGDTDAAKEAGEKAYGTD